MTKAKAISRSRWSKIYLPPAMADALYMLAKHEKWQRDDIHLFIYDALKKQYPEGMKQVLQFLDNEDENWNSPA